MVVSNSGIRPPGGPKRRAKFPQTIVRCFKMAATSRTWVTEASPSSDTAPYFIRASYFDPRAFPKDAQVTSKFTVSSLRVVITGRLCAKAKLVDGVIGDVGSRCSDKKISTGAGTESRPGDQYAGLLIVSRL